MRLPIHLLRFFCSIILTFSGMASTFEGMARGLPMLCIPVFADQHRNSHKLETLNVARVISIEQVTVEKLSKELNEMLTNDRYTVRAKEIGDLFNDYMIHPMDEAIFWIEHVIRSKGAGYLKSKAVNLYWFQYYHLDIWILLPIFGSALYLLYKVIRIVVNSFRKRRNRLSDQALQRKDS